MFLLRGALLFPSGFWLPKLRTTYCKYKQHLPRFASRKDNRPLLIRMWLFPHRLCRDWEWGPEGGREGEGRKGT